MSFYSIFIFKKKNIFLWYIQKILYRSSCVNVEGEGTALAKETAFFNNIENTFQLGHIAVVECFYVILETLGSIPRIQLMKKQENKGRKGEGRKEEGKTGVDYDIFSTFFIYYKSRNHIFQSRCIFCNYKNNTFHFKISYLFS